VALDLQNVDGKWIALHVRQRSESRVAALLREGGYRSFLPLSQHNPQRALFPGYIFCLFSYCVALSLVKIPGVSGIVSFGGSVGTVSEDEIDRLKVIDRTIADPQPWPYMSAGETVLITTGPLQGLTGYYVREAGRDRIVVSVTLLLRSVALEIAREWIQSVPPRKTIQLAAPAARAA
jgi:transcription antitermination factor NusG